MDLIHKQAKMECQEITEAELALINQQALRPLGPEDVFTFRMAACGTKVDRDGERFTPRTLDQLAKLYAGKPVLMDHIWSAEHQVARVYAAGVEGEGEDKALVLRCYMPRSEQTASIITAIESGVLRECSVGCSVERVVCSICGRDQRAGFCQHSPGREYDGHLCVMELDGAKDAYEISLVAVPAQPEAGIIKAKRYGPEGTGVEDLHAARLLLEIEEKRFRKESET